MLGMTYTIDSAEAGQFLIGADGGSFSSSECTCGSSVGSDSTQQWTAPNAGGGNVEIGITKASKFGSTVSTYVVLYFIKH